ncbi:hypothetical protein GG344DRAFT_64923 [Lentinula edodes]|nr:hypothetical protein GG344DRAFT_64923 [Lentinula edodes]
MWAVRMNVNVRGLFRTDQSFPIFFTLLKSPTSCLAQVPTVNKFGINEGEDPAVPISQTESLSTGPSCSHKENFLSQVYLPPFSLFDAISASAAPASYVTTRDHEANGLKLPENPSSSRTSNRIFPTEVYHSNPLPVSPYYNYENRSPVSKRHRQTESDDIMINSKGSVDYPPDVVNVNQRWSLKQSKPSPLVVNGDGMPPNLKAIVFYNNRSYRWNGVIPSLVKSSPLLGQIHNMIESDIKAHEAVQAYQVEVFFAHFYQPPKFKDHKLGISVRYYVDTVRRKDFPGYKNGTFTFIPKWEDNQPTLENQRLDSTWQYIEHLYTATKPSNSTKKSFNPAAKSFDPSKQPVAPYDLKLEWH